MNETALWINKDKRRFYRAWVYQDLLDDWVLMRIWGSLDSSLGGERKELLSGLEEGLSKLQGIHKRRVSRQYSLVDVGSQQ